MALYKILLVICFCVLGCAQQAYSISLVYNIKLRRIFALGSFLNSERKTRLIGSVVPIIYTRKRHIVEPLLETNMCEKRFTDGALFNIRFISGNSWWAEATTGIEREHAKSKGTAAFCTSRTGLDDIVLSGGHNSLFGKNTQFALYGLVGLPTRTKVTQFDAQDPLVGTRFFNIGVGAEISCGFVNTLERSLVGAFQVRFIHAFNRKWFPSTVYLHPGNVTDFLLVLNYREKKNIFEAGYNLTLLTNQILVLPTEIITTKPFLRSSMYATYAHVFLELPIVKLPGLIGAGFYLAFLKEFHTKASSYWLNLSVLF